MSKDHFQLTAVEVGPDYRLRLSYADGQTFEVDLCEWIKNSRAASAMSGSGTGCTKPA